MPLEPLSMLLYKLFLFCYPQIAKLLGLFNPKARLWSIGQQQVWEEIAEHEKKLQGQPIIWIHAASYGEFEQGLPIIEAIKLQFPKYKIWLTFFSPSGYLHRKNDPAVDAVTYAFKSNDSFRRISKFPVEVIVEHNVKTARFAAKVIWARKVFPL